MAQMNDTVNQLVKEALDNKELPHIYFNGFTITGGNSDILIVLQRNQKPIGTLNCSFTIAKTLVQKLNDIIRSFESTVGQEFLTTDIITSKLNESVEGIQKKDEKKK
jgi:hypothetical protein